MLTCRLLSTCSVETIRRMLPDIYALTPSLWQKIAETFYIARRL